MGSTMTSFVTLSVTATHDGAFRITDQDIPFYEANFHIALNDATYGDMTAQNAPAASGSVITFPKGNLKDIWFKNAAAAANCQIICVAVVPTEYVKAALGL
jgi:hypothetical protein